MEVLAVLVFGTAIGLVVLWLAARSAITVCLAEVRDGKLTITRGAIAPRVLADLRDVVKKPRVKRATIRIVRAKDRARAEMSGDLSEAQIQRVRNVVGTVPLAQLANASAKKK